MATKPESKKKAVKKSAHPKEAEKKTTKIKKPEEAPEVSAPKETVREAVPAEEEGGAEWQEMVRDIKRPDRYFEGVGRRKTSVARVRLYTKPGDFTVNNKLYGEYFRELELQHIVEDALQKMKLFGRFKVSVKTSGGGMHGQAEALRHGLSRCLIKFNPDFRKRLKRAGFLKRDPRSKERKKPGLKKARRAPQWAKR